MKANFKCLKFYSKLGINPEVAKSTEVDAKAVKELDAYLSVLIGKIKEAKSSLEVDNMLINLSCTDGKLKQVDYVNFKYSDYNILATRKMYGESLVKNLEKLNNLGLSIVPELVSVLEKGSGLYIITKNAGTKDGLLKRYNSLSSSNISRDAKLRAYKDMLKLTKAGLIDENVFRGKFWYYTPENKILIPMWKDLRPITSAEMKKDILERYYRIIFGPS